jgi:hypothetical protein
MPTRLLLSLAFTFSILAYGASAAPGQPIPPRRLMRRLQLRQEERRPFLPVAVSGALRPSLNG